MKTRAADTRSLERRARVRDAALTSITGKQEQTSAGGQHPLGTFSFSEFKPFETILPLSFLPADTFDCD